MHNTLVASLLASVFKRPGNSLRPRADRAAGRLAHALTKKTRASWIPTTQTHSLLRQRDGNESGRSPFEHWHDRPLLDFIAPRAAEWLRLRPKTGSR